MTRMSMVGHRRADPAPGDQIRNRLTRIVVVSGPPCAGKSLIAGRLATGLGVPHLQMDVFRQRALPESDHRVEHRDVGYRAMHFAAELMIPLCGTVIVDATYTASTCRQDLAWSAQRLSAHLYVIECGVSAAAAVERFFGRGEHPALDLDAVRVGTLAAAYPYSPLTFRVDGMADAATNVARSVAYVAGASLESSQVRDWVRFGLPRELPGRSGAVSATASRQAETMP